jgi:hypothetical protein
MNIFVKILEEGLIPSEMGLGLRVRKAKVLES